LAFGGAQDLDEALGLGRDIGCQCDGSAHEVLPNVYRTVSFK
jgi:hypothetical protein